MPIESIGWFFIGAGAMALVLGVFSLFRLIFLRIRTRKFRAMIKQLKEVSQELSYGLEYLNNNRIDHLKPEVSELTFRDRYGALNTVKIIIDPLMNYGTSSTTEDEFIFSTKAVEEMRAYGIEPDEAVTKMLKASGRMP